MTKFGKSKLNQTLITSTNHDQDTSDEVEKKMKELEPLIKRAKEEKKWLYCSYQSLWFSPEELEKENSQGRFRWGPLNWDLRDPGERIHQIEKMIKDKNEELKNFKERMVIVERD